MNVAPTQKSAESHPVFYDIETKELLDPNAPDQDAAIRTLHLSVGVTWCECHDTLVFHSPVPLAEHLLAHERIIGFNIIHFDNAVLAWSRERSNATEKRLPDAPDELKQLLDAKSFDLLADLEARLGHRVGLAALAEGTLGKQKPSALQCRRTTSRCRLSRTRGLTPFLSRGF